MKRGGRSRGSCVTLGTPEALRCQERRLASLCKAKEDENETQQEKQPDRKAETRGGGMDGRGWLKRHGLYRCHDSWVAAGLCQGHLHAGCFVEIAAQRCAPPYPQQVVSAAKVCDTADESPSVKRLRLLVADKGFSFKAGQWNLVLIAGGVGINPLLSILRHSADLHRERADKGSGYEMGTVTLFYSAKNTSELLFKSKSPDLPATLRPSELLKGQVMTWAGTVAPSSSAIMGVEC
ncbi:hypothetical protein CB1_001408017 [Camelus ferus]|nr:hypothetical protein CB1_001408017 [Camelus ferus]